MRLTPSLIVTAIALTPLADMALGTPDAVAATTAVAGITPAGATANTVTQSPRTARIVRKTRRQRRTVTPTPNPAPTPAPQTNVTPAPQPQVVPPPAQNPPPPRSNSAGVWRPFNASSPWNTPIPANPAIAPDSQALINDMRSSSPFGEHLDININQYSVPVFYATPSTPMSDVLCDIGGFGFVSERGYFAVASIPMPADAASDSGTDHTLAIIDRARNMEWGMFNAHNFGGRWTCTLGAGADLTGDGTRPYKPQNPTWYTSHGARACGFPLIAGLIRTEEIEAGHIDHALVVAYPHIRAGYYMYPASTAQTRISNDAVNWRGIPCGGRIQLDPNVNIDALGLTRSGRIVAQALQTYGAYVGDYSGAINLYAENAPQAKEYWRGKLDTYEFRDKLDMRNLRALQFGPLTDDGNGN